MQCCWLPIATRVFGAAVRVQVWVSDTWQECGIAKTFMQSLRAGEGSFSHCRCSDRSDVWGVAGVERSSGFIKR